MASDASHALEAALEQMDGIIAGAKTGADIRDGSCEPALASPASHTNPFPVLHLIEDLRLALEMLEQPQERAALLSQIPGPTAAYIKESLISLPWYTLSLERDAVFLTPLLLSLDQGCTSASL
nr:liprin-beta-2-like [Neomonachus schauinslandi]